MADTNNTGEKKISSSRRGFMRDSFRITAASALAGVAIPRVHAGEDNTIRLALIGCGGRGSGAVANAMAAGGLVMDNQYRAEDEENAPSSGPVKLVAMADLLQSRLDSSHKALSKLLGDNIDVPEERRFRGFDAYKKAIDCLKPGDVAMLTTHAAFRVPHLEYAVEKGVNVFMEKDFAADPGGIQKIVQLGEAAEKKNLKIATGLMCRHSSARQALIQKIRDGEMGDTQLIRAYRMGGNYRMGPFPGGENELLWQLRPGHPYQLLWSSGGIFIELMIHQIDECFWIKDSWPVSAHGIGGGLPAAPIAARISTAIRSSTPLATVPRRWWWDATFLTARASLPPTSTARSAPRSSPAIFTPPRFGSTRASRSIRIILPGDRKGDDQSVAGRMDRAAGRDPQRSTTQRGSSGGAFQLGSDHGPGGGTHRQVDHLGGRVGV